MDEQTPSDTQAHEQRGGLRGWMQGRGRWVAAGGLAVLLAAGIGTAGYAVGATAAGEGTDQGNVARNGEDRDRRDSDDDGSGDGGGNDEVLLTGADLSGVTEAVEAEYPGSIVFEAETDDDGVFEAHLVTTAGQELTVELDADYEITGVEAER